MLRSALFLHGIRMDTPRNRLRRQRNRDLPRSRPGPGPDRRFIGDGVVSVRVSRSTRAAFGVPSAGECRLVVNPLVRYQRVPSHCRSSSPCSYGRLAGDGRRWDDARLVNHLVADRDHARSYMRSRCHRAWEATRRAAADAALEEAAILPGQGQQRIDGLGQRGRALVGRRRARGHRPLPVRSRATSGDACAFPLHRRTFRPRHHSPRVSSSRRLRSAYS